MEIGILTFLFILAGNIGTPILYRKRPHEIKMNEKDAIVYSFVSMYKPPFQYLMLQNFLTVLVIASLIRFGFFVAKIFNLHVFVCYFPPNCKEWHSCNNALL